MSHLAKLLREGGNDALFKTAEGRKYLTGAVHQIRRAARFGASVPRIKEIRDKLPKHIRGDILHQSYTLLELVGRCDVLIILLGDSPEEMHSGYREIFASLYCHTCECEDSLRRLCKLVMETYAPQGYDKEQDT